MKRPHSRPLVYGFAALLAIALVAIGPLGCTDDELSRDELSLGPGTSVNLTELWGMVAEEAGAPIADATLVQLEMTLSPAAEMSGSPDLTARVEELHFVAWAHGPTIRVTATWPESGSGELVMETDGGRDDPMPPPVGYPLAPLFTRLDRVGMSDLLDGLQPSIGEQAARLVLVYPPPPGPYGEEWGGVPFLVLRGGSLELVPFGEDRVWRTDFGNWTGNPGVFQVLSASSEKLLAIFVVVEEKDETEPILGH